MKYERYSAVTSTLQGMLLHGRILMDRLYQPLHRNSCPTVVLRDLVEGSERVVIGITRGGSGYQSKDIKIRVEAVAGAVLVVVTVSMKLIQMKQNEVTLGMNWG